MRRALIAGFFALALAVGLHAEEEEKTPLQQKALRDWIEQVGSADEEESREAHKVVVALFVNPDSELWPRDAVEEPPFFPRIERAFVDLLKALCASEGRQQQRLLKVLGDIAGSGGYLGTTYSLGLESYKQEALASALAAHGDAVLPPLVAIVRRGQARLGGGLGFVAAQALSQLGEPAVPPLLEILEGDWQPGQQVGRPLTDVATCGELQKFGARSLAALALARIESAREQAAKPMIEFLLTSEPAEHRFPPLRCSAGADYMGGRPELRHRAFAPLGTAAVKPLLAALDEEGSPDGRVHLLLTLGVLAAAASEAAPALQKIVQNRDEDPRVREQAVETLGRIRTDASVATLIDALTSEDQLSRSRAQFALTRVGIAAIPRLIELLEAEDAAQRVVAADILGVYEGAAVSALPALVLRLKDDDVRVSLTAAWACGEIVADAEVVPEGLVESLASVLADENEDLRVSAAEALGNVGEAARSVVPALVRLAEEDPELLVRMHAVIALTRLAPERVTPEHVRLLVAEIREDMADRRERAREAIGRLPPEAAEAIVPMLAKALSTWREAPLEDVVRALGLLGLQAKEAVPALESFVESGGTDHRGLVRRDYAREALWKIRPDGVRRAVRAIEASPDEGNLFSLRMADPVQALRDMGPRAISAVPVLLKILKEGRVLGICSADEALGAIGAEPESIVPLLAARLDHSDGWVRRGAAAGLGLYGPAARAATTELVDALSDPSDLVRRRAAGALGRLGADASRVVPALIACLEDDDSAVRREAAYSLAQFGSEARAALPALEARLRDRDVRVQAAATRALHRIRSAQGSPVSESPGTEESDR
jgi:HEAT repeat protein